MANAIYLRYDIHFTLFVCDMPSPLYSVIADLKINFPPRLRAVPLLFKEGLGFAYILFFTPSKFVKLRLSTLPLAGEQSSSPTVNIKINLPLLIYDKKCEKLRKNFIIFRKIGVLYIPKPFKLAKITMTFLFEMKLLV